MARYLIADTHLNHPMLVTSGKRPPDYQERIINNWRANVGPDDTVLHLGDVIMRNAADLASILAGLPGRKVVVRGNHDESCAWLERHGFDLAVDSLVRDEILFTHVPATPLPEGIHLNVHGHLHRLDDLPTNAWEGVDEAYYRTHPEQYALVSIEETFTPILLDDFVRDHRARHAPVPEPLVTKRALFEAFMKLPASTRFEIAEKFGVLIPQGMGVWSDNSEHAAHEVAVGQFRRIRDVGKLEELRNLLLERLLAEHGG
jgi:calcineurin-like phosphoesterase family protein